MKKIAIIGASGHGKVIADIALRCGYKEVAFLDDNPSVKIVGKYKVLGSSALAYNLALDGYDFIVGIGNANIRERIQNELINDGCNVVTLVHPNAEVAYNSCIGKGTVVMAGAVIGTRAVIGNGCIINTLSVVGCDNEIGDYAHVSVGACTGDNVQVTAKSWVGIGSKIESRINIAAQVVLGAGACVVNDIDEAGTYVGVPARKIK